MKKKTKINGFIIIFTLVSSLLLSCGSDDSSEPVTGVVTGCNTFTFRGNSFELPLGNCSAGSTIDFDITENGESFKFKITCDGSCISEVVAR